MPDFPVRKIITLVEEILHEGGATPATPRLRGVVIAVVKNPFAGRYEPNLEAAMEDLKPLVGDHTTILSPEDTEQPKRPPQRKSAPARPGRGALFMNNAALSSGSDPACRDLRPGHRGSLPVPA